MILPKGILKRPKPECPHKIAVYKTWRRITRNFTLCYNADSFRFDIEQSPILYKLDKTELRKSFKAAHLRFRRENQPNRKNQII